MSDDRYDEPERPRYFRESPPREETKEEKKARVVFLIALCMLAIGALIISQDIGYRLLERQSCAVRAQRAYYFPLTRIENTMPKKKSLNVYHLSATENTLRKMPKFNPYQTGHGVIGDTKYNRRKTKRELRKLIDES